MLILHLLTLGCIAARMYADNFFTMNNSTMNSSTMKSINETHQMEPKIGMYKVIAYTWFTIAAGSVIPFLSIILLHTSSTTNIGYGNHWS